MKLKPIFPGCNVRSAALYSPTWTASASLPASPAAAIARIRAQAFRMATGFAGYAKRQSRNPNNVLFKRQVAAMILVASLVFWVLVLSIVGFLIVGTIGALFDCDTLTESFG